MPQRKPKKRSTVAPAATAQPVPKRVKAAPTATAKPSKAERGRARLIDANAKSTRNQQRVRALRAKREAEKGITAPARPSELDVRAIKSAAKSAKNDRTRIAAAFEGLRTLGYVTATEGLGIDSKDAWEYLDDYADNVTAAELASNDFKLAFWPGDCDDAFGADDNLQSPLFFFHRGDLGTIHAALAAAGMKADGDYVLPAKRRTPGGRS